MVLDLDHIVWSRNEFAAFRPDAEISRELDAFVAAHPAWVVEGCYGRWMEYLQPHCTKMVFLNPGEAACLANCLDRPWEPEKYSSKGEQNARLPFLLEWGSGYYSRTDDLSLFARRRSSTASAGRSGRLEQSRCQAVRRFRYENSTTEQSPRAVEATPFDDGALYDLFFDRLDLGLDFYFGAFKAAGGPVLDVACGTGQIMFVGCVKTMVRRRGTGQRSPFRVDRFGPGKRHSIVENEGEKDSWWKSVPVTGDSRWPCLRNVGSSRYECGIQLRLHYTRGCRRPRGPGVLVLGFGGWRSGIGLR